MAPIQLIHDTTIVTADDAGSILYDAALAVRDGRIAALGRALSPRAVSTPSESMVMAGGVPGLREHAYSPLTRSGARHLRGSLAVAHTSFTGGLAPLPLPALSPDEERDGAARRAVGDRSGTTLVLEGAGLDSYAEASSIRG
jgi:hypothetical protein